MEIPWTFQFSHSSLSPQGPHNQRNQEGCSFAAPGLRTNLTPQIRITVTLGG
jgi:hypothetical protein